MTQYRTPMHDVIVNEELCGNALECLKCVKTCINQGLNCLMYINQKTPELGETAPKSLQDIPHKIFAGDMYQCNGCQECIKVCPKGALTFVPAKMHIPRAKITKSAYNINCSILADGTLVDANFEEELKPI